VTTTLTTPTSSTPLTAATSEKENHRTQDTEPSSADDNATGITGMAQNLASTSSGSTPLLASINDNEPAGQHQSSAKRVKGLAVIGTGLTDKYFRSQQVYIFHTDILVEISA
jgi:hypothetical protein